jgi:hypothetical protein
MKHDRMGIFLLQYLKNGALSLTGVNCYEFRLSIEAAQGKLKGIQLLVPRLPAFMRKIEPYFPYERSFAHKVPELAKLIVGMQFRALAGVVGTAFVLYAVTSLLSRLSC